MVTVKFGKETAELPLLVVRGGAQALLGQAKAIDMLLVQLVNVHQVSSTEGRPFPVTLFPRKCYTERKQTLTCRRGLRQFYVDHTQYPSLCTTKSRTNCNVYSATEYRVQFDCVGSTHRANGRIGIYGDFKLTVNKVATTEVYPVPRLEETWAKVAGGRTFLKLDLCDTYQQVELEPEAKKFVNINTQRGLFQYNRLPFFNGKWRASFVAAKVWWSISTTS